MMMLTIKLSTEEIKLREKKINTDEREFDMLDFMSRHMGDLSPRITQHIHRSAK